jgi:hypothetical protein
MPNPSPTDAEWLDTALNELVNQVEWSVRVPGAPLIDREKENIAIAEAKQAILAHIEEERTALVTAIQQESLNHLAKIEQQEGGGMLDLMAVSGVLKHDEDSAFRRDRLVSERRAVILLHDIVNKVKARSTEERGDI